jgi:hypothetical protein
MLGQNVITIDADGQWRFGSVFWALRVLLAAGQRSFVFDPLGYKENHICVTVDCIIIGQEVAPLPGEVRRVKRQLFNSAIFAGRHKVCRCDLAGPKAFEDDHGQFWWRSETGVEGINLLVCIDPVRLAGIFAHFGDYRVSHSGRCVAQACKARFKPFFGAHEDESGEGA